MGNGAENGGDAGRRAGHVGSLTRSANQLARDNANLSRTENIDYEHTNKSLNIVALGSLAAFVRTSASRRRNRPRQRLRRKLRPSSTAKYAAKVPASVTTPDTVQTRIGTLKFSDGLPDADTVKKVYDNLDFVRGVEAFLLGMPAATIQAMRRGFVEGGFPSNQGFGISEGLADARSLFLTPNTVVVYCWGILDVKDGPMVLEVPPGVLGILNDAHLRFVTDLGLTGPDQGKGGKYLVVPPGYKGTLPSEGYFVQNTRTFSHNVIMRGFIQGSDLRPS